MTSNPFHDVQSLLNSYYNEVSCAQIDYEVDTGLVCETGFSLIRKAISHIAVHIEKDSEDECREAKKCLAEAVLAYRCQLYADKSDRIAELFYDIQPLVHLMSLNESLELHQVKNCLNDMTKLEKDQEDRDWRDASGVYTQMCKKMEDIIWDLDCLLIALKSRNFGEKGGDING